MAYVAWAGEGVAGAVVAAGGRSGPSTVTLLPMGYAVWRTRDIRIGIATHIGINGGLGFLLNVLPRLLAA
jgi:hypothetical protein